MKPYLRHLFICLGDNCSERGADDSYPELLQDAIAEAVRDGLLLRGAVKVTQAQCLGACGFGPNIAIYPEGVWYYGVKPQDIRDIVTEHLVAGKVVSRLLLHKYGETMPDEVVRDKVCGMVFHTSEALASFKYRDEIQYFCGEACQSVFQADPLRFLHTTHHTSKAHSGH